MNYKTWLCDANGTKVLLELGGGMANLTQRFELDTTLGTYTEVKKETDPAVNIKLGIESYFDRQQAFRGYFDVIHSDFARSIKHQAYAINLEYRLDILPKKFAFFVGHRLYYAKSKEPNVYSNRGVGVGAVGGLILAPALFRARIER